MEDAVNRLPGPGPEGWCPFSGTAPSVAPPLGSSPETPPRERGDGIKA